MKHDEFKLQKAVCEYLNLQYREVLYCSDTIANIKLSVGQATRNKQIQKQGFKTPDLIIFAPRGKYHGLFIELKIESPFKKDGTLYKNEHIEGQAQTISDLNKLGYFACFCWSFDGAKKVIDDYMKQDVINMKELFGI